MVKEQIQWVLSYVQGESVDIWKKNVLEDLKNRSLEFMIVEEFLIDLKKEFSSRDNKTMKVMELKKVEQENRMMEKFVQVFRRVARESEYERRLLIEEFKKNMNE